MFLGEFEHTIDSKGRLAVPAKFRVELADGGVITRGLDGCLVLYSINEWESLAQKISDLPMTDSNVRSFQRFMLSGAMTVVLDKQGRVVLPAYLREYAAIQSNVVVAGLSQRIEIWDLAKWQDMKRLVEENSNDVASRLTDLGI